jgi:hypothetical protein
MHRGAINAQNKRKLSTFMEKPTLQESGFSNFSNFTTDRNRSSGRNSSLRLDPKLHYSPDDPSQRFHNYRKRAIL